ncbi:hypothetical protein PAMC26510_12515 [Caballeronia sordidicola]|uniref:Uncharacterized protein n=1 Tax=Caballeronia sordidicola TaxID=196367 RepID=A0A242MWY9_CABSO|nr:hypothetical protein PAMC26510_12515 [Caballeronia sordidicola]
MGSRLSNLFTYVKENAPLQEQAALDARLEMLWTLQYIKPLEGTMMRSDGPITAEFYQESEWRYVLQDRGTRHVLFEPFDKDVMLKANAVTAANPLAFTVDDIRYLFVAKDADIPPLYDFINSEMPKHWKNLGINQAKVLCSRIVSQESLAHDL